MNTKEMTIPEKPIFLNIRGRLLDLSTPRIMAILNVTPDSFYSGSRISSESELIKRAAQMLEDGADILDIGGYSSRPGAHEITSEEEGGRVLSAIRAVNRTFPEAVISVDTFRAEIASSAVEDCGAAIINDISGGEADASMFRTVARLNVPYVMMHMQGTPGTMQMNPVYDDVAADIIRWFGPKISRLHSEGVRDIIIDPGFGFGKTTEHNFALLDRLGDFKITGQPLLAGFSRKSMIWKTLGITPGEALNGTTVLNTIALLKGADILRVHDVREAAETIRLAERLKVSHP